ncbi:phage tail sheath subtilisin-like domain-containing protein [Aliifodinibius sp. S!AR15-10]|uniref:phage tail sheath family protein n=1 Tax=Aliifodinibius sp. S!AR15-10 TaxID=2950437 RepID=UPI002866D453|nr:phage tail sheath C-terminal domain-containing protein [Aliifodinibius sp. S!AR15-10]MDR8390619.1 phage tail sheath subtilisin-like domain-containing protein [Aliifodinibius sp. S!AR15-10]
MDYKTPGVFIEEISTLPASIAGVETAIPAFIGYTEKAEKDGDETALFNIPTRISSLLDYVEKFGGPVLEQFDLTIDDEYDTNSVLVSRTFSASPTSPSPFIMYYSLQFYFNNGGGPCYIVSVGDQDTAGTVSEGTTVPQAGILGGVKALEKVDEPTLIVFPDAVNLGTLTAYGNVVKEALAQCNKLQDRFTISDMYDDDSSSPIENFRGEVGTSYLKYGAVYHPFLETSLTYVFDAANSTITHNITGTPPTGALDLTAGPDLASIESSQPSIYRSLEAEINKNYITLPPSGAVAGIYARVDRNRGVWKAPANVSVNSVVKPIEKITNEDQRTLNVDATSGKSINAIRTFTGKGTLVWGARTLAGNDNEWRYVPVRRLFIYVEESVKKATEFVVFEPNDANTWVRVRAMIENFLSGLWREGALAGATAEQAFFVKVGLGETMTAQDILEGRMIVEIGMAAVRPAEFIIIRFMHKLQES